MLKMPVYVDDAINKYGDMKMSHMIADTLDELLAMADKIGVSRRWLQTGSYPHFDICQSKRKLAIRHGAIGMSSKELVMKIRNLRGDK